MSRQPPGLLASRIVWLGGLISLVLWLAVLYLIV